MCTIEKTDEWAPHGSPSSSPTHEVCEEEGVGDASIRSKLNEHRDFRRTEIKQELCRTNNTG